MYEGFVAHQKSNSIEIHDDHIRAFGKANRDRGLEWEREIV
jgi:hypothetical protein